jgi:hypothetical protein
MSELRKKYIKSNKEARIKLSDSGKKRAAEGNLPKLPIMIGKDNPASKERILISPQVNKYIFYNHRNFCKENEISPQIILRNINKGEIKSPTDKKILDRQRKNSKNTIGWIAIE